MRKTFVAITALALVPLGAAGCVSKSEYTKTVQAAEARYNALDAVKPERLVVLSKVIEILKTVSDKSIRIEGHTDNKPIVGPLVQRYPTNWELSAGRAINVARYLQKQGIEAASLSAAAFGEFKP